MAKINNSDYSRWAKRKSTKALTQFLEKFVPYRAKQRMFGTDDQSFKTPKYLDRKIAAAHKELKARDIQ